MKKFLIKPYVNYMKADEFPFLQPTWASLGSALREGMQLETLCDMKNIESYCSQISINAEKEGGQRREFVMVGRSNVGKSSLINAMVEANIAKTSNYPGKTRQLYFYNSRLAKEIYLVDAPGYGYARGDKKELERWGKMMITYFTKSQFLHRVVCLIDAEHGIKEVDMMLYELLEKKMKPFLIVFTKCDKMSEKLLEKRLEEAKETFKNFNMSSPIIHATSAKIGWGIFELRANLAFLLQMDVFRKPENLHKII